MTFFLGCILWPQITIEKDQFKDIFQFFKHILTIRKSGFLHTPTPNRFYRGTKGYLVGKHADFCSLFIALRRENQIFVSRNPNFPL